MTPYPVKIVIALLWLMVAWWFSRRPALRSLAGCLASAVMLVHVFVVAGMWIQRHVFRGPTFEGAVVPYIGFVGGIGAGLVLGIVAGLAWSRNNPYYWLAHIVAIAFLLLLPLYKW